MAGRDPPPGWGLGAPPSWHVPRPGDRPFTDARYYVIPVLSTTRPNGGTELEARLRAVESRLGIGATDRPPLTDPETFWVLDGLRTRGEESVVFAGDVHTARAPSRGSTASRRRAARADDGSLDRARAGSRPSAIPCGCGCCWPCCAAPPARPSSPRCPASARPARSTTTSARLTAAGWLRSSRAWAGPGARRAGRPAAGRAGHHAVRGAMTVPTRRATVLMAVCAAVALGIGVLARPAPRCPAPDGRRRARRAGPGGGGAGRPALAVAAVTADRTAHGGARAAPDARFEIGSHQGRHRPALR